MGQFRLPVNGASSIPIVVYKLHVSTNFFTAALSASQSRFFVSGDVPKQGTRIGKTPAWKEFPSVFALDAMFALRSRYGMDFVPAIIPPTYAKLRSETWLQRIWAGAREALSSANSLVFIGYSFPESDGFMRSMFAAGLAHRSTRELSVLAIDPEPSETVFDKYKKVFKPLNLQVGKSLIRARFCEAFQNISDAIHGS